MVSKYVVGLAVLSLIAFVVTFLESRFSKECPICGSRLDVVHTKIRCFAGFFVCIYSFVFYYFFTNRIVDLVMSVVMVSVYMAIIKIRKTSVRYDCKKDKKSFVDDGCDGLVEIDSW